MSYRFVLAWLLVVPPWASAENPRPDHSFDPAAQRTTSAAHGPLSREQPNFALYCRPWRDGNEPEQFPAGWSCPGKGARSEHRMEYVFCRATPQRVRVFYPDDAATRPVSLYDRAFALFKIGDSRTIGQEQEYRRTLNEVDVAMLQYRQAIGAARRELCR